MDGITDLSRSNSSVNRHRMLTSSFRVGRHETSIVFVLMLAAGILLLQQAASVYAGIQIRSDRAEAGLIGNVEKVEMIEHLVKETHTYDRAGRLLQRVQEPVEGHGGIDGLLSPPSTIRTA